MRPRCKPFHSPAAGQRTLADPAGVDPARIDFGNRPVSRDSGPNLDFFSSILWLW